MWAKWYATAAIVGVVLAGCNFSRTPDEVEPTAPATRVAQHTATATALPTTTAAPTATPTATSTVTPTQTELPPTHTATSPAATISPTLTPRPTLVATPFPSPTQTAILTFAPPPTFTPVVYVTNTPPPPSSLTPSPTSAPAAKVCATCTGLRLRAAPGTAGDIMSKLAANTPLTIIGRTGDNAWLQVVLLDGVAGWVYADYVDVSLDLNTVGVTGMAEDVQPDAGLAPVAGDIVSGVSSNARQIFLDGLAKGNLPHAFTKVGDSITASPNYLTPIGRGNYALGNYGYLGGAISFFSGPNGRGANPFAAASIAARNGWSTESVLDPANADPNVCRAGETPLECEYRLSKPAVALIMFGTNDSGGMPSATFQANLQAIVQKSIARGVIPVLSTIPPKHFNPATDARIFEFNQIIVATARAYDVPLWDYYAAMAALPGEGLAPDGVHPSAAPDGLNAVFDAEHLRYGYPVRNLTALYVLYQLWQQVLYDADQAIPATAAPAPGQPVAPSGDCSLAPPARLTVGRQGRITPGVPNKVRSAPGTGAAQIGNIPGEGVFQVIGGPQCADGYRWWQVDYQGLVGWTASGTTAEYWVEPYP